MWRQNLAGTRSLPGFCFYLGKDHLSLFKLNTHELTLALRKLTAVTTSPRYQPPYCANGAKELIKQKGEPEGVSATGICPANRKVIHRLA